MSAAYTWLTLVDLPEHPEVWTAMARRESNGTFQYVMINYETLMYRAIEYDIPHDEIEILLEIVLNEVEEAWLVGMGETPEILGDAIFPYDYEADEANALYAEWLESLPPLQFDVDQSIEVFAAEVEDNNITEGRRLEIAKMHALQERRDLVDTSNHIIRKANIRLMADAGMTVEMAIARESLIADVAEIQHGARIVGNISNT